MTPPCGCQVKLFPEPIECPMCRQQHPVNTYQIVFCPLHQQAEALRNALQGLLEVDLFAEKYHAAGRKALERSIFGKGTG